MPVRNLLTYKNLRAVLALLLVIALICPPLVNVYISKTYAVGVLTNYKLQINNSQASATGVTYQLYATATTADSIKQIDIEFCTTGSGSCVAPTGMDTSSVALSDENISGTSYTTTAPAANSIRIVVGTPAAQNPLTLALGFTGIVNPSTTNTTFYARINTWSDTGTTKLDYGTAAFAILTTTSIAVTASVDPHLSFAIAAVNSGGTVNGATTNVTTTAATIPLGSLVDATPKIAAHDITINTNASSGYTVTASNSAVAVDLSNAVLSSGSANIDKFSGTNASPTTWSSPNGSSANTNTGFFGYTTEDSTLCIGTAARFTDTGNEWAGPTTTGAEVICSATGVDGQTTRVGWQAEVNSIQPPGAYSGTVILIATPTY